MTLLYTKSPVYLVPSAQVYSPRPCMKPLKKSPVYCAPFANKAFPGPWYLRACAVPQIPTVLDVPRSRRGRRSALLVDKLPVVSTDYTRGDRVLETEPLCIGEVRQIRPAVRILPTSRLRRFCVGVCCHAGRWFANRALVAAVRLGNS